MRVYTWKGRDIETLSATELRRALRTCLVHLQRSTGRARVIETRLADLFARVQALVARFEAP